VPTSNLGQADLLQRGDQVGLNDDAAQAPLCIDDRNMGVATSAINGTSSMVGAESLAVRAGALMILAHDLVLVRISVCRVAQEVGEEPSDAALIIQVGMPQEVGVRDDADDMSRPIKHWQGAHGMSSHQLPGLVQLRGALHRDHVLRRDRPARGRAEAAQEDVHLGSVEECLEIVDADIEYLVVVPQKRLADRRA
jgi:hypothetical protein